MISSYIKIVFRQIFRNKLTSAVSILSLAVGISFVLLISVWIKEESSYDNFHSNENRIYKIDMVGTINGKDINTERIPDYAGYALTKELPEVEDYFRVRSFNESITVRKGKEKIFREKECLRADSNIFKYFDIPIIGGDRLEVLSKPKTVVISRKTAEKYFSDINVVGETIVFDEKEYEITGVADFTDIKTHLQFDFLFRMKPFTFGENSFKRLQFNWVTYIKLHKNADPEIVSGKILSTLNKYLLPILNMAGMKDPNFRVNLVSVQDAYLHSSESVMSVTKRGNINNIYIMLIISLIVIIIASLNYTNMTLAKGMLRSSEISIRKTNGASKKHILYQFMVESLVLITIAFLFSIIFAVLFLPTFNSISNQSITIMDIFTPSTGFTAMLIIMLIAFVSGVYPSVLFARTNPAVLDKGKTAYTGKKATFRKTFVILQYSLSIILIIVSLFMVHQIKYMREYDLGFSSKNRLVINIDNTDYDGNPQPLKEALLGLKETESVSVSYVVPGTFRSSSIYTKQGEKDTQLLWDYYIDYDYLSTHGIKLLMGRNFTESMGRDATACILNEKAVKLLKLNNPLNSVINQIDNSETFKRIEVIGVIKNFHTQSLQEEIRPIIMQPFSPGYHPNYITVEVKQGNINAALASVESVFSSIIPGQPFEYFFIDDYFNRFYSKEEKFLEIFTAGSLVAILLSCFGLFGLAFLILQQRTKEVGIRKILGATVPQIMMMLTSSFSRWILIANVIAWPVAYIYINSWLENYAYKAGIGIGLFILAGGVAFVVAILTILSHTLRAAFSNPVKSLRYE